MAFNGSIDAAALDPIDVDALHAFAALGGAAWTQRIRYLEAECGRKTHAARAAQQRHSIELAVERCRRRTGNRIPSTGERHVCALAVAVVRLAESLPAAGRDALMARLALALADSHTLIELFHLVRTARLQAERGFAVHHAGLVDGTPYDLLIERDGTTAEIACVVVSAEEGRDVRRGAWFSLMDRVDPDLQLWLAAHPGRYLLKMTLPKGLREDAGDGSVLADLHARISAMLKEQRRADQHEASVLRLDPLMLAAAQADELGLMGRLRREFGPEAHLAATAVPGSVFVMAARAAREDAVAVSIRKRMCELAPERLTGTRPGIVALFVEDTDRAEWRLLRERMDLEGEMRQFMTCPEARSVVAISCASRLEMFGLPAPEAVPQGELRFRNPAHPAAKTPALAPAVLSST